MLPVAGLRGRMDLFSSREPKWENVSPIIQGVFANEKRTEFGAKLVSTDTGCYFGLGFSRLARSATPISASSHPRKLGYEKLSSYMGLWDQKSQHVFHYCRGAQTACKREEKRKAEVISLEGTSRSEWQNTCFCSGKVAELSLASREGSG